MRKVYTVERVLSGERNTKYYITGEECPYLVIYAGGTIHWYEDDWIDRPSSLYLGSKIWYLNDGEHREDGPSSLYSEGSKLWCLNNKLHRTDGPVRIEKNGTNKWWINDKITNQEHIEKLQEKYFYKWKRKMNFKT